VSETVKPNDISNEMICSIAETAAEGIQGIDKLFMRLSDQILDVIYPSAVSNGVKVIKQEDGYHINLHVITKSGINIPDIAKKTQIKVKEAVEVMTGKQVAAVNVHVIGSGKY